MSDPRVSNWGRVGRVCIWRYTSGRHAGGWHFVADAAGRDSLRKLFRLLATARWPGRAEMKVDRSGEEELRVPNFRGGVESPEVVHIRHAKGVVDPPAWRIERQGEREIVLRLHDEGLRRFAEAMGLLETADAEFALAPKDVGVAKEDWVWFWR